MTSLLIGFTLPKTRRVLERLIRHHRGVMLQLLLFIGWFALAWPELRGVMDNLGARRYGAGLFSGEHYVVDVIGAAVVAGAIAFAAKIDYGAIWNWTRSRAREAVPAARPPEPVLVSRARLHHRERAQALLEFAFIAPFMLVLLLTIVDFGLAIDRRLVLQHAVREGARFGAVSTDCSLITQRTFGQAQGMSGVTVQVSYPNGSAVGDPVKVSADFTWNFPIASKLADAFGVGPLSVDMTPSGTARLEQSVPGATGCSATS